MSRTLVTGAAGSIGKELVKSLLREGSTVCAFDNNEDSLFRMRSEFSNHYPQLINKLRFFLGDIRDQKRIDSAFKGVEVVFHCAALKHVALCEYNPTEAVNTNIYGTQNVIEAAISNNIKKVILTSSDKAVNPSSAMGASKLVSERLFLSANSLVGDSPTVFTCVRFGNVWNTNGSVGKIFKQQVQAGLNITLTDKRMTRFFVTMKEAVDLCLNVRDLMLGGETFVLDMGAAKIIDIANEFIRQFGQGDVKEIGLSPGEKLYEELYTEIEGERAVISNGMYIILPENNGINNCFENTFKQYKNNKIIGSALRSDSELAKQSDLSALVNKILDD
mgnify:CR=1 FL=1|tara:strand:+ start:63606 stop:64604 length:999 start_codon:yes stop_codon:yes gene_type:complete